MVGGSVGDEKGHTHSSDEFFCKTLTTMSSRFSYILKGDGNLKANWFQC